MKPHTICAWCKAVLHEGDKTKPVSHGICEACDEEYFGECIADGINANGSRARVWSKKRGDK